MSDVWIFTVGSGNENERTFRDDCIRHVSAVVEGWRKNL